MRHHIQFQFFYHLKLRLISRGCFLLVFCLWIVFAHNLFRFEGLELDYIGAGLNSRIDHPIGKFEAAVVTYPSFGNDESTVVGSW